MPTLASEPAVLRRVEKTTVRYTRCAAAPTASSLLAQLGYLEDEFAGDSGLAWSLASLSLDPKLHPTRAEQFSLRHAGTKSAWARAQGADLRVIALSFLQGHFSAWALAGSGIRSLEQVKGRRLAVLLTRGEETLDLMHSGNLRAYETALASVGLTLDQVELVKVTGEKVHFDRSQDKAIAARQLAAATRKLLFRLVRGEVDVILSSFAPDTAATFGLERIFNSRDEKNPAANPPSLRALVVHGTLIRERFDEIVRLLARLLQSADWAKTHPEQAARLVAVDHRWAEKTLLTRYPALVDSLQIDLDRDKIIALQQQTDFYLRHGFTTQAIDAETWIDPRPLEAAHALVRARRLIFF